jgi:predicted transcriptional regulator
MKIRDCVITPVKSISKDASIKEVAELLYKTGQPLIVIDDKKNPIGIISFIDVIKVFLPNFLDLIEDPDILKHLGVIDILKEKKLTKDITAQDIMSSPVRTVDIEDSLLSAIAKMKKRMQRQLLVRDGNNIIGLITAREILKELIKIIKKIMEDGPDP